MGIVGCGGQRTGGWGHPPLRRVTMAFVGAAVPSGPESPRRFAARPPFTRGARDGGYRLPRRPVGSPCNDRLFDRLGSPCGGAGTASAVTERAASLVKGRWHGAAVTEGFRPPENYPKNGIPQSASLTASPIPFVPSGHFPLIRGIGLAMTGFLTALAPPVGELARRQP